MEGSVNYAIAFAKILQCAELKLKVFFHAVTSSS
jgi:hypothetical protein